MDSPSSTSHASGATTLVRAERADLGLAFTDTCYWRQSKPTETLHAPADLLRWCAKEGVLDAASVAALEKRWAASPNEADARFAEGLALRETIYRVFKAQAADKTAAAVDLAALNMALEAAPKRALLAPESKGYVWRIDLPLAISGILAAVLWTTGDLLASPRRTRVRQCANPQCGGIFLDDSKSGTRRWCMMSVCGNRAKAHRHYMKRRKP
ncbi:MAG: CGNR zinc finger domain-containing protein [Rhodospirillales bacterium]|nr:CGNR zinc finger domain-containing protein [Rhodospirillales bacterium]